MGSAAAWRLAGRGRRVLALDAHPPGHRLGSSHGHTRIIRKAYFEDPAYVPLLERAYPLWDELERASGDRLRLPTGGLMIGPGRRPRRGGSGAQRARCTACRTSCCLARTCARRFPAFALPDGLVGLWEPQAGILFPERCVRAMQRAAAASGADLRFEEPVRAWWADGTHAVVETAAGTVRGRHADRDARAVGAVAPRVPRPSGPGHPAGGLLSGSRDPAAGRRDRAGPMPAVHRVARRHQPLRHPAGGGPGVQGGDPRDRERTAVRAPRRPPGATWRPRRSTRSGACVRRFCSGPRRPAARRGDVSLHDDARRSLRHRPQLAPIPISSTRSGSAGTGSSSRR